MAKFTYMICNASVNNHSGTLIDGGANGGLSGSDVRVIELNLNTADILGLAAHVVIDIPIATVAAVINTVQGNIIGIFHQYACTSWNW